MKARKSKAAAAVPSADVLPLRPADLDGDAAKEWDRVAELLRARGALADLDPGTLTAYCQEFSRWTRAERALAEMARRNPTTGGLLIQNKQGNPAQNPLVGIASRAASEMARLASRLGISRPANDSRPAGLINIGQAAERTGKSRNAVREWIRRGMPAEKAGNGEYRIDPDAMDAWLAETESVRTGRSPRAEMEYERTRKLRADADLTEMEREERRGQLIPIAVAAKRLGDAIAEARTVLLAIPNKLAPQCAAETDVNVVRQLLEGEVYRSLTALSRGGIRRGDRRDDSDMEAADEIDGEPMGGPLSEAEPGE